MTQALRTALGMGADRAVHVNDDGRRSFRLARCAAKILAAVAKAESPDLVFTGLMSDDGNYSAVPPMLAELLGQPSATGGRQDGYQENGGIRVERELEGGAYEVVDLPKPAVIAIQTGANQVRYASLKGIMQAKKKPVDVKTHEPTSASATPAVRTPRSRSRRSTSPPKGDGAEILSGSTDDVVGGLMGKIKELGLL